MTAEADIAPLLQYAVGGVLVVAVLCGITSFFVALRSIMGFASRLGNPVGSSSDSKQAARMFDGPEHAAERRRLGLSILVFVCSLAILFAFILIKNHLTCCQLSANS